MVQRFSFTTSMSPLSICLFPSLYHLSNLKPNLALVVFARPVINISYHIYQNYLDVMDIELYRPVESPVFVPMLPCNVVSMLLIVLCIVPMVVHVLVVVHVLMVVDVLPRLLVGVLVLVVVPLLVLVRVVVLMLVHNTNTPSLPLLQQAGRGKNREEKEESGKHSGRLFSTKVEMRLVCLIFPTTLTRHWPTTSLKT